MADAIAAEYRAVIADVRAAADTVGAERRRTLASLRREMQGIGLRDQFPPERTTTRSRRRPCARRAREVFDMKWATRESCHVDRTGCACLIRRFIDHEAVFVFVDDPDEVPADATAFDLRGIELSHHDGDCSFEAILRRYQLDDPVLWDVARIVHEADVADDRYDSVEAPGLDIICRGLSMVRSNNDSIEVGAAIFDGRYEHRRRAMVLGREPA
jgi:hypothetical protein